jgi:hypothetical protein
MNSELPNRSFNIPANDWEEMLEAVSKNPNQVRLLEVLRVANCPTHWSELPIATTTANYGASEDQINNLFRKAKLPYRIRGQHSWYGRLSVRKTLPRVALKQAVAEDWII